MSYQIQRTIALIKKAYDQPVLFHLLYAHLAHLLGKSNNLYEMTDDWSKLIIFGCSQNNLPNQGLETKISLFLKKIRPPFSSDDSKLKFMIICYYFLSRPAHLINHIILFDLISNFLNISDYFDGLILSIFNKSVISKFYGLIENKKLKEDSFKRMIQIISNKDFSLSNKIKALASFTNSDMKPFDLSFIDIEQNFIGFKYLEYICFYAKFAADTSHIKFILPNNPEFIQRLSDFINFQFNCEFHKNISLSNCIVEDRSIFDNIKKAYEISNNKQKFISDISEFLMNLK